MSPYRRFTGVLLQAALLAMPLSGTRADCSGDHAAMTDMADMPVMPMPDGPSSNHDECPPDTAPQCANMVACGSTFMVVEPLLATSPGPARTVDALHFPRDPRSVTRAPDPPPPRA